MSRSGLVIVVHNMVSVFLQSNHFCITQQSADNLFTDIRIQDILIVLLTCDNSLLGNIVWVIFVLVFFLFNTWPENTECSQNKPVSS